MRFVLCCEVSVDGVGRRPPSVVEEEERDGEGEGEGEGEGVLIWHAKLRSRCIQSYGRDRDVWVERSCARPLHC